MNIGKRFKKYRLEQKLSQKEAADLIGINSYQLANYETGRSEPSIQILKGMSKVYKVSIDVLVGNKPRTRKKEEAQNFDTAEFRKKIESLLKDFDEMSSK